MKLPITLAACASLALVACGAPADDTAADAASATEDTADPAGTGAPSAPEPAESEPAASPTPAPTATDDGGTASIPVALRGRWGLVPADCTSTRGDNKGLITVSANDLRFYESVARLGAVSQRDGDSIRATWNFTGEGMNWTRDLSLAAQGSNRLVRTEYGAEAMAEPLTYTKCA